MKKTMSLIVRGHILASGLLLASALPSVALTVTECDRMVSHKQDDARVAPPVEFSDINADRAIAACQDALKEHSNDDNTPRLTFLLARSYMKKYDGQTQDELIYVLPYLEKADRLGYSMAEDTLSGFFPPSKRIAWHYLDKAPVGGGGTFSGVAVARQSGAGLYIAEDTVMRSGAVVFLSHPQFSASTLRVQKRDGDDVVRVSMSIDGKDDVVDVWKLDSDGSKLLLPAGPEKTFLYLRLFAQAKEKIVFAAGGKEIAISARGARQAIARTLANSKYAIDGPFDPDKQSLIADGLSSLIKAVELRDYREARRLILDGADVNATSPDGYTALSSLFRNHLFDSDVELLRLLLRAGANANVELYNQATDNDQPYKLSPLHVAAQSGYIGPEIMKMLVDAGADTDVRNSDGETPAHVINLRDENAIDKFRTLINAGADFKAKDKSGNYPLTQHMFGWTVPEVVDFLLDQGLPYHYSVSNSSSGDAEMFFRSRDRRGNLVTARGRVAQGEEEKLIGPVYGREVYHYGVKIGTNRVWRGESGNKFPVPGKSGEHSYKFNKVRFDKSYPVRLNLL